MAKKNTANATQATLIAMTTAEAYSRNRYTDTGWMRIAQALLDAGATQAEAEWVLNSKHMRWAADDANRLNCATSADFLAYANKRKGKQGTGIAGLVLAARKELAVAATLTGADLAGACEGEQIADLIDFARTVRDETTPSGERGDGDRQLAILRDKAARILAAIEARAK